MSFRRNIKEYFSYSASEKRGLLVLLLILMVVWVLPVFFSPQGEPILVDNKNKRLDSLFAVLHEKKSADERMLFSFDPNVAGADEFSRLGLTKYQINNIIRYRDKGGKFKTKSDFQKIYGIDEEDYDRLKAHIQIGESEKEQEAEKNVNLSRELTFSPFDPNALSQSEWEELGVKPVISKRIKKYLSTGARFKNADDLAKIYGFDSILLEKLKPYIEVDKITPKKVKRELIDLNLADTSLLKTLPGIGTSLSRRIVKYKKLLGGYVKKSQLLEVYGLSEETYLRISSRICISTQDTKKIYINECSEKELSKHPYLNRRMSSDIIRYRERLGKFGAIEELKSKHLLTDSVFRKIEPYLKVQ